MSVFEPIIGYKNGDKDAGAEFAARDDQFARWFFGEIAKPLLQGAKARSALRGSFVIADTTAYVVEYLRNYLYFIVFPSSGQVRQLVLLGAGVGRATETVRAEMEARLKDYLK